MKNRLSFLAALVGLTLVTAELRAAAARPNILWIVSEDNSPQLGCYGDPYARTPNLDTLARDGVRFTNAAVPYSVCSPSRAAFLTGLYPQQNGQLGLTTQRFAMYRASTPGVVTRLQAAGYRTGLIGKLHVRPEAAFPFDFRGITGANFNREVPIENYTAEARKFWAASADRPWFLSVNFPDAHLPFVRQAGGHPERLLKGTDVKPLPWVGVDSARLRDVTADYYNCMARLDIAVGQLLAALQASGAAENTLVIYFSDHGAQFPRGKYSLYEGGLKVPMLIRWPGRTSTGLVRQELVSTLDLLPTVLQATGLPPAPELPGRALQPLLRSGATTGWREYSFAVAAQYFVQESVRNDRWKLIWSPPQPRPNQLAVAYLDENQRSHQVSGLTAEERAGVSAPMKRVLDRWEDPPLYELYDLKNDPYELENLADDSRHTVIKNTLIGAMRQLQVQIRDPFSEPRHVEAFANEQKAMREKWAGPGYPADFSWSYIKDFHEWRERRSP